MKTNKERVISKGDDIMEIDFSKVLHEKLGDDFNTIITSEKEFGDWIDRLRWHVQKCDELGNKFLRENKVIYEGDDESDSILCPSCKYEVGWNDDYSEMRPKHCPNCGCKLKY